MPSTADEVLMLLPLLPQGRVGSTSTEHGDIRVAAGETAIVAQYHAVYFTMASA
jgi:hypothetical protein